MNNLWANKIIEYINTLKRVDKSEFRTAIVINHENLM